MIGPDGSELRRNLYILASACPPLSEWANMPLDELNEWIKTHNGVFNETRQQGVMNDGGENA